MNKAQQACELFLAGFASITTALAFTTQQVTKLGLLGTERQLEILNFNIVVTQTRSHCPEVNDTSTDVDGFRGSWFIVLRIHLPSLWPWLAVFSPAAWLWVPAPMLLTWCQWLDCWAFPLVLPWLDHASHSASLGSKLFPTGNDFRFVFRVKTQEPVFFYRTETGQHRV